MFGPFPRSDCCRACATGNPLAPQATRLRSTVEVGSVATRGMGNALGLAGKVAAERLAAAAAAAAALVVGKITSVGVTGTGLAAAAAAAAPTRDVIEDHECIFPVQRVDGEDDNEGGVTGEVVTQGSLRRISAAVGRFVWSTESIRESRHVRPG